MLGGNYVNRFSIDGPQLQGDPADRARRAADPRASSKDIYVTGPERPAHPAQHDRDASQEPIEPRTLNRFQQLNAVKISGVATAPLDQALRVPRGRGRARSCRRATASTTPASRASCAPKASKFLPALVLALVLIFLVLAAQFNSFRDPFVILAGSVPLAMFGALIFTFLKFAGPPGMHFELTEGWTTTLNIYSQVGLVTLVGLVAKNGILIVEFANELQETGLDKVDAVAEAARTRLRPILMTTVATVGGHFPLTLVTGPGAVARNSIGIVLVGGMTIGTLFTLFVVPSVYVLIARDHTTKGRARSSGQEMEPERSGNAELVPEFADA